MTDKEASKYYNGKEIYVRGNNKYWYKWAKKLLKTGPTRSLETWFNGYSSYESMKCGLNVLSNVKGNKIIILGDMLELGKYSKKYHKKLNKILDNIDNKIVLTVGEYTKYINSMHFNSNKDIIDYLDNIDITNTTIFIKGSNSMKLNEIVDYLIYK